MSSSSDLQSAISALLEAPGALPSSEIPVLRRRPKVPSSDIQAAIAASTLCIYVMPPLPIRALKGTRVVFFDKYEIRIRIVEQPAANNLPIDGYQLIDDIALALQWQNPDGILAHPLELATRPVEAVEDKERLVIDVIFDSQLQLNPIQP